MKRPLQFRVRAFLFLITGLSASVTCAQAAGGAKEQSPTWVELGENGQIIARQALGPSVNGLAPTCRAITIDGASSQMQPRANRPANLPVVCQAVIPKSAKSASIGKTQLPLPNAKINNIVIIGDTGCRGDASHSGKKATPLVEEDEDEEAEEAASASKNFCDPGMWHFPTLANQAAAKKPDLVVHVGDYVYVAEDDWTYWSDQFFKPAQGLLLAAPWIFVRGNHESCVTTSQAQLHGASFLYLLDPRDNVSCPSNNNHQQDFTPPYSVTAGGSKFIVMDSAAAECDDAPSADAADKKGKSKSCSAKEFDWETGNWKDLFSTAIRLGANGAFLLTHRPVWGLKSKSSSKNPTKCSDVTLGSINAALQTAYQESGMTGLKMVLAGHIHTFQLTTFQEQAKVDLVPQLLVGDSGVNLNENPAPPALTGCSVASQNGPLTLANFYGMDHHGFGVLPSDGSSFNLYRDNGRLGLQCAKLQRNSAQCIGK